VNAVVQLTTMGSAHELLAAAKRVERDLGRAASERWGPRLIDVDVLLYGDETIQSADLVVPHPELWNRRFVLQPLAEVLPAGPLLDRVEHRLQQLGDDQEVVPLFR